MPNNDSMCKCCLEGRSLKELWGQYLTEEGDLEVYGEMLTDCFVFSWMKPSDSTEYICDKCIDKLRDVYQFRRQILAAKDILDNNLLDSTRKGNVIKEEIIISEDVQTETQDESQEVENVKEEMEQDGEDQNQDDDPDYQDDDEAQYLEEGDDEEYVSESEMQVEFLEDDEEAQSVITKQTVRRPYCQYTQADIDAAVEMVVSKKMTRSQAARAYQVPIKTLGTRVRAEGEQKDAAGSNGDANFERAKSETEKLFDNIDSVLRASNATPIKNSAGPNYHCSFCILHFSKPKQLKKHTLNDHDEDDKKNFMKGVPAVDFVVKLDITDLKCKVCEKKMNRLEELMNHISTEHEFAVHRDIPNQIIPFKFDTDALKCCICKVEFGAFKLLHEHMIEHYGNFKCDRCDRAFINKTNLRSHSYRHESGEFPCQFCDKVFKTNVRVKNHERVLHKLQSKPYRCEHCDARFTDSVAKNKHQSAEHGVDKIVYRCFACESIFARPRSLKHHIESFHLQSRRYPCNSCTKSFSKSRDLNRHLKTHLRSVQPKIGARQCEICLKSFRDKKSLLQHVIGHAL